MLQNLPFRKIKNISLMINHYFSKKNTWQFLMTIGLIRFIANETWIKMRF